LLDFTLSLTSKIFVFTHGFIVGTISTALLISNVSEWYSKTTGVYASNNKLKHITEVAVNIRG